jgi:hypothetical protein
VLFRVYCGAAFPLFELRRAQRSKSETTGKRGCGTEAAPAGDSAPRVELGLDIRYYDRMGVLNLPAKLNLPNRG